MKATDSVLLMRLISKNYVVHEWNWKVDSAKMMERMRSRVSHFAFNFVLIVYIRNDVLE